MDANIRGLLSELDAAAEPANVIVTADHGASAAFRRVDVAKEISRALPRAASLLTVCNNDGAVLAWSRGHQPEPGIPELAEWCLAQPWSGPVFANPGLDIPGTFSTRLIGCDHERLGPDLLITMHSEPAAGTRTARAWYAADASGTIKGSTACSCLPPSAPCPEHQVDRTWPCSCCLVSSGGGRHTDFRRSVDQLRHQRTAGAVVPYR